MRFKRRFVMLATFVAFMIVFQSFVYVTARPPIPEPPGVETFRAYGYVRIYGTSTPIPGATVQIYENSMLRGTTYTSSTGYFSIYVSGREWSDWFAKVTKSGYQTAWGSGVPDHDTRRINMGVIYMTPAQIQYTIHGYVREILPDGSPGDPISGATVNLYRDAYEGWSFIGQTTSSTSGDIGHFSYTYTATSAMSQCKAEAYKEPDYYPGVTEVSVSGTDVNIGDVNLWLKTTIIVHGNVKDYVSGTEVPNSDVEVHAYWDGQWHYMDHAETNPDNGQFVYTYTMFNPEWDGIRISVSATGYNDANRILLQLGPDYDFGTVWLGSPVKKYAVIVAVDDYKDESVSDLLYSHEDANNWTDYLTEVQGFASSDVWVYGDSDSAKYSKYDDLATEFNVKSKLIDVINIADENDLICFIMSGHGGGSDGGYYGCMWDIDAGEDGEDGEFWDYEFADIMENTVAGQVFVFLSTCHSGGIIPEIQALSNHEVFYVVTHCGPDGVGYQNSLVEMSLLTHWFLERGLRENWQ
ncbi:MAG: hypothetical protein ACFFD6_02740, partial [Candidatus Thorarchaeota archaeon]